MANTLTKIIPQLLAQGLMALRERSIAPQLVNRAYETMAGQQGSTIDVPIPSAIAVQTVTPGNVPPSTADVAPTSVSIPLSQWEEAPFYLTDKDRLEIQRGSIPMIASAAIKALANSVDKYILALGSKFYGTAGTAGVTPFTAGTTKDATDLRTVLSKQLADNDDRHVIFNPDAEGSALGLRAFQDASWSGSPSVIIAGKLNMKLGFMWWMDQNVQSHVSGTGANYQVNLLAGYAAGTKTIAVDIGTGTLLVGDIIKFSTHTQTYVVTSALSAGSVSFEPGLLVAVADNVVITGPGDTGGVGDHVMNLGFHRDAIAFATRPLLGSDHPASIIESATDPISGLTLRLEMTREHKRDRFSFDILYGAEVIRRELGARLLG